MSQAEAKKRGSHNPRYAAYVIDAKTGKVLFSRNAHARRYPASLTKMMTLYLVFEDLKSGRIKLNSRLVMSKAGWRREPSKLGLRPGQSISMKQAIYSLVTKSANDVATALGDQLSGSEAKFAKRMTRKARQLGMKNTTFKNANGLTARGQTTTAADMAKLGLALREHFPRRYKYFQTRVFKFGKRRYSNHNRLLGKVRGVDGIKTGYTRASGYNLVSSVSSGDRRIVAVVMGGRSGKSRNAHMTKLIRQFLPKASRRKARRLVASYRSSRKANVKTASVAVQKATSVAVASKLKSLPDTSTPTPQLRRPTVKKPAVDHTKTASVTPRKAVRSGWQIQITASDDRSKAMKMLKKARSKNRQLLADAAPMTQMIVKNGTKLYRGRFTGFSSKASARRACKILKKQRFACLALSG
ncbi:MAG: D-alanyl-D-alanine carboxypeptidase [Rhizobiaceae bacterium]|nr:D-alanyl-D-alanine carboxypeptidase [Rhizobiaceae bacterium]